MNNILAIRKRLGLQQSEFADAIGVTQSNVSHYENGRNDPSLDVGREVVALAKAGDARANLLLDVIEVVNPAALQQFIAKGS